MSAGPSAAQARNLIVVKVSGPSPDWSGPSPAAPAATGSVWGAPAEAAAAPVSPWGASTTAAPAPTPSTPTLSAPADFATLASGIQLQALADAAPLGTLLVALGEALALPVSVHTSVSERAVTMANASASVSEVEQHLATHHNVSLTLASGQLSAAPTTPVAGHRAVVLPSPDGVPATHFAATWCALEASEWGVASVLGDSVRFRDNQVGLDGARALMEDAAAAATAIRLDAEATTPN